MRFLISFSVHFSFLKLLWVDFLFSKLLLVGFLFFFFSQFLLCKRFYLSGFVFVHFMHELISQVLERRDLSKAGELFNIDDWDVVTDLQASLSKLTEIFNSKSYQTDANSQSVVEICLARITSAVR